MSTLRISKEIHATLKGMAESEGVSMQKVLDRAVEAYRRQRFLEEANAAYGALRLKPDTWREEQEEREAWEATLADGIPSD